MRGLAEQGFLAHAELARHCAEPRGVGFAERGDAFAAVPIHPAHMPGTLPRNFHEIAEEILVGFGKGHPADFIGSAERSQCETG